MKTPAQFIPKLKPSFCSGFGQYHTDEPGKDNRKPYAQITLEEIRRLVDNPQEVDKPQAPWIIASTLQSRKFKEQEANGEFGMLWGDIDKNPKPLNEDVEIIETFIPNCDYEIYTTKTATQSNQKFLILIQLKKPWSGSDWVICQEILNYKLESNGIIPDGARKRPAELC